MGDHSVINPKCRLDNRGHIYIGSNVSISQDVLILTASHDLNNTKIFKGKKNPVKIMDYVFIGTRAIILPGVIINEGGVVGAGSIVTKDVSPYTVVAGNPARPIGTRIKGLTYNASYRRLFQ
ncbi:acyltransferase [Parapedobacter koreensis]|nr:acyltransferase [Parapedobacter koreensis]